METQHHDPYKKDDANHNKNVEDAPGLLAGLSLLIIPIIFVVVFFINPQHEIKYNAYACDPPTPTPTPRWTHGREPTSQEWSYIHDFFPNVTFWDIRVTGEEDSSYICHTWGIIHDTTPSIYNDIDEDQNGELSIIEYNYYTAHIDEEVYWNDNPFVRCDSDDPDRVFTSYSYINGATITHTSRKYNNELDESKLGQWIRISHPTSGLDGGEYGNRLHHFKLKP